MRRALEDDPRPWREVSAEMSRLGGGATIRLPSPLARRSPLQYDRRQIGAVCFVVNVSTGQNCIHERANRMQSLSLHRISEGGMYGSVRGSISPYLCFE